MPLTLKNFNSTGGGGRQPGANTVLYLPLDEDLLDHSLSPKTITNVGNIGLVSNIDGATIKVAQFNSASKNLTFTNSYSLGGAWTICSWFKTPLNSSVANFMVSGSQAAKKFFSLCYQSSASRGLSVSNYETDVDVGAATGRDNTWHMVTATYNGIANSSNNIQIYVDGNLVKQGTTSGWEITNNTTYVGNFQTYDNFNGYISKFIFESVVWTAQEVSDYFDLTKSLYGIS